MVITFLGGREMSRFIMCSIVVIGMFHGVVMGTTIIGQDFDSFSANVSGFVGSSSDTGGRWGNFLLDGSPNISTTFAHSGNNSLVVERGKAAPFGRVAAGTDGQRFEISYWQFRYDYPSSTVITPGVSLDESSFTSCLSLGIFIQGAGNVFYFNGTAWVDTGYDMAKQKWTRIRQDVDLSKGTYGAYDLYLMEAGGTEIKILSDKALSETISTVNAMQLNPQGTTGTKTYFDDIQIVPEPMSVVLLGLGALLGFRKKNRVF